MDKYEENLGFEKSFVSLLATKSQANLDEMRKYYEIDFQADMEADLMR